MMEACVYLTNSEVKIREENGDNCAEDLFSRLIKPKPYKLTENDRYDSVAFSALDGWGSERKFPCISIPGISCDVKRFGNVLNAGFRLETKCLDWDLERKE